MCYTAIKIEQNKIKGKIENEVQGSEDWMMYMHRFFDLDYQLIKIRNEKRRVLQNNSMEVV